MNFFRTGWRPTLGWGLALVVVSGGLYEFLIRHFIKMPGNDVLAFVAYLTAVGGLVWQRGQEKAKGAQ